MEILRRIAALVDVLVGVVSFVRMTPSRRARAAEEGWSVAFMRRIDWAAGTGSVSARLSVPAPCGCRMLGSELVAFDVDCTEHDPLGAAD